MTPTKHLERRWLYFQVHKNGQNQYIGKVFTTDAACKWLYCCNIEGNTVTILSLWTPKLRKLHGMTLTEEVIIELLAQGILHANVHPEWLLVPAQQWPLNWRQAVCKAVGLTLTDVKKEHLWKAAELLLYTLHTDGPRAFASKCVVAEEGKTDGQEEGTAT
jgi:hypothetical protein